MPYEMVEQDGKYCMRKVGESEPTQCFPDKEQCQAAIDQMMSNEGKSVSVTPAPHYASELQFRDGGALKALGDGRVGGHLITYEGVDLQGEYFGKDTDFGEPTRLPVLYHHGFDETLGRQRIGMADLKGDEFGLWAETQLDMADKYQAFLYDMAAQGKLGWSSGAASHTVDRQQDGDRIKITRWLMAEASLTPTPAEPRNMVSIKTLIEQAQAPAVQETQGMRMSAAKPDDVQQQEQTTIKNEVKKMDITKEELAQLMADAGKEAVKAYAAEQPEPVVKSAEDSVKVTVTHDPADNPFGSIAEQCKAVKDYTKTLGRKADPRLMRLMAETKAVQGAAEGVPSDGGILLDATLVAEVIKPVHEDGAFSGAVRRLPVGSNSNFGYINGVDETSRATGSRWGGIRGYRLAEGDSLTKSKPQFTRLNWELKKYGVLVYGTDELLADAAQFSAIVEQGSREELSFMLNDDILNGLGVSGAKGVMTGGALITVTRDTASKVLHADIVSMWARMDTRSKGNAAWYINAEVQPQLDALYFSTGADGIASPFVSYGQDGVMRIYGRPVVETEFNPALNTTGDILLADMSQYLMWEKQGVQAQSSIHVEFLTDQEVFRFIYRADGMPAVNSPITPYKGVSTRSPFVCLSSAT